MATRRQPGRYEKSTLAGEGVSAFIPDRLPPPIKVSKELGAKVRPAEQKLSRLELAGDMVPSPEWFIYAFVRKEAVVSTIADEAADTARDLFILVNKDRARVLSAPNASVMAARLLDQLPRHPMVTIPAVVHLLGTTKPTAAKAIGVLEQLGAVRTGSAAPARATRSSFPLRRSSWALS